VGTILFGPFGSATVRSVRRALVPHAHSQFNLLFKLSGADIALRIDKRAHFLDERRAILLNRWIPHAKLDASEASVVLLLHIEPSWLAGLLDVAERDVLHLFEDPCVTLSSTIRQQAESLAIAISGNSLGRPNQHFPDMLRAYVHRLCLDFGVDKTVAARRPTDFRIRRAMQLIEARAVENPSPEALARSVGLSRSRFFEQFKRCVGTLPSIISIWSASVWPSRRWARLIGRWLLSRRHSALGNQVTSAAFSLSM
jgi:AraC family transcriptional regulator